MGKERKCILCEIIYNSKQEMDEHMRSMLHHRELENIKGRDCGHECRVCGVTVVGLTDYARHISSPVHKQRVEAQERQCAGDGPEEEYFDKELVQLIEKRKEQIRKEETAAKLAQEEEEKKLQQRNEERQWLQQHGRPWGWGPPPGFPPPGFPPPGFPPPGFPPPGFPAPAKGLGLPLPPKGAGIPNWRGSGARWNSAKARQCGQPSEGLGSWNRQGRSSTWHTEVPPNLQKWGGRVWGGKKRGYQGFPSQKRGQSPMPGGDGLYNGSRCYWEPSAGPYLGEVETDFTMELDNGQFPLSGALDFSKGPLDWEGGHQAHRGGPQNREIPNGDHGKANGAKIGGSGNTAKDRLYRWAPYPLAKLGDAPAQTDEGKDPTVEYATMPPVQVKDLKLNFDFVMGSTQSPAPSRKQQGEKSRNPQTKDRGSQKIQRRGSSSSRRDDKTSAAQKSATPLEQATERASSTSSPTPYRRASMWDCEFTEQGQPQSDMLQRVKEALEGMREDHATQQEERQEKECRGAKDLEAKQRKNGGHQPSYNSPELVRHHFCPEEESLKKLGVPHPAQALSLPSLQSIQVSTSTCETAGGAASSAQVGEEEEDEEEDEEDREGENDRRSIEEMAMQATDEGLGSDSDVPRGGQAQSAGPDLSKLGLPASLKRDLTRHIGPKGKAGGHEPNLNIARRIRNVSGARKGEAEKDSGLRPTLRQLISSTGSRRNVNWDQVYQEVSRKKQEQGKGMPRFGIEMVTSVPYDLEGLSQEEGDDSTLAEGYQWDSICESYPALSAAGPRKRSLSESSVVGDRASATLSLFPPPAPKVDTPRDRADRLSRLDSEPQGTSHSPSTSPMNPEKGGKPSRQGPESVEGDSSCTSETEQNDTQGLGKKRRAAGEMPSPEIPSLERKNKRRKIKCKKERSQVDQLLAVSLREEELSSSLQAVDSSLIQARTALQAAYMEVQRLLVVKQQVTMEMSTLRTRRIEILQGMQEGYDAAAAAQLGGNIGAETLANAAPTPQAPFSPLTEIPAYSPGQPPPAVLPALQHQAAPPSSLAPANPTAATTLHIKQEPISPSSLNAPAENPHRGTYGAVPEPQLTTSLTESFRRPSLGSQESVSVSASHSQLQERGVLVSRASPLIGPLKPGATPPLLPPFLARRRDSQPGATDRTELLTETSTGGTSNLAFSSPAPLPPPSSSSQPEVKGGKRVRKLRKKKALRKALGQDQPENSDTEQDGDGDTSSRPVRRVKIKKRAKGAQVSTSTPASTGQEQEANVERAGAGEGEGEGPGPALPPQKARQEQGGAESEESSLEMVELPQATPLEVVSIDSSDAEGGLAARFSAKTPAPPDAEAKPEPRNLGCDEVSSTSELDPTARTKACASQTQPAPVTVKAAKENSEVSSEPGEEEPTEGSFEGHQGSVNTMQIHNGLLYTCSSDRTVRAFDLATRKCVAVFEGHSTKVNCLLVSCGQGLLQRLYTGSSDQTIRCYNVKTQQYIEQLRLPDRVLCLHNRWKILYAGLANGSVVSFSLKNNRQLDVFDCHGPRAVSCIVSAQEGARRILLVGSYDCTISVRDAKSGLLLRTLEGHTKTVLCMKVVNDLVFSGSSDQSVHAHNIHTGELVRIYKGHTHAVTVVAILGKVMVTACLDKLVRVYELQSHDRLQVYGGHKDMVMCMAIHKSMIYTGCYDGSVQAVRLNLIQNHRCWWHGCSLIFGVMEHLKQHLLNDHTGPSFQTLKCRWKNCDAFFTVRNNTKQDVPLHMHKHAEEDSKLEA